MRKVDVHQAKAKLSRFLPEVEESEPFIIERAGKPVAKVTPLEPTAVRRSRIGLLYGEVAIPESIKTFAA